MCVVSITVIGIANCYNKATKAATDSLTAYQMQTYKLTNEGALN